MQTSFGIKSNTSLFVVATSLDISRQQQADSIVHFVLLMVYLTCKTLCNLVTSYLALDIAIVQADLSRLHIQNVADLLDFCCGSCSGCISQRLSTICE